MTLIHPLPEGDPVAERGPAKVSAPRELVCARVDFGEPIESIAEDFGVSRQRIAQIVQEERETYYLMRRRQRYIIACFDSGHSGKEIARMAGVDETYVSRVLKANGRITPTLSIHDLDRETWRRIKKRYARGELVLEIARTECMQPYYVSHILTELGYDTHERMGQTSRIGAEKTTATSSEASETKNPTPLLGRLAKVYERLRAGAPRKRG